MKKLLKERKDNIDNNNCNHLNKLNKENKINFIEDNFLLPHFKNKITLNKDRRKIFKIFSSNHYIDKETSIHLNSLKLKYQQDKDYLVEEYVKASNRKDILEKISDEYERLNKQTFKNDSEKARENAFLDYIQYKYDKFSKVDFSSQRIKNIILKN